MAFIKPCNPALLPLKNLDWSQLAPYLGDAREAVARLDEQRIEPCFLEPLFWCESIASLKTQDIGASVQKVLLHAFTDCLDEKLTPFLQKILLVKEALDKASAWGVKRSLGQRFFCQLHAIVKRDALISADIGHLRTRQNWIGFPGCKIEEAYFYPPPAAKVRPLLQNFESYLEGKDIDPLVQTAIAFAHFLIIHPFMDGNGRVARIFIPFFAMKKKLLKHPILLLSSYFEKNRKAYFLNLLRLTTEDAWETWIIYFLKGVAMEAARTKHLLLRLQTLYTKLAELVGEEITEELFQKPVLMKKQSKAFSLLEKGKVLIARGGELYLFEPLIRAMRQH